MQYRKLGARGPMLSTIGFGAWAIGGLDWGATDDEVSKRAIHAALDTGVTFIDTADNYGRGHSEKLVAEVLAERGKGDVIVATKASNDFYNATKEHDQGYGPYKPNTDRDYLIFAAEQSLKRLRVDCLDILQLHSPPLALLERDDPWEALATLKQQGKIRWAGLSVQSFKETEQAHLLDAHADVLDCIQVRYNLLEREAEKVLFPKAMKYGIGVIVRIPLLFGLLTGKFTRASTFGDDDHRRFNLAPEKLDGYLAELERLRPLFDGQAGAKPGGATMAQTSLRFCLSHPACHVAIPGAKTPAQALDNAAASDLGPLPAGAVPAAE